jgi:hypothetical protein
MNEIGRSPGVVYARAILVRTREHKAEAQS